MKGNSREMKLILVLIVIVCALLGGNVSTLKKEVAVLETSREYFAEETSRLRRELNALKEKVERPLDVSYSIVGMDWNTGCMQVEFEVNPISISEHTRVVVSNGKETVELSQEGTIFSGLVNYPIDTELYETTAYLYAGETEKAYEIVGNIGATDWASDAAFCTFYGYSEYGNGKWTLAGDVRYKLDVAEEVEKVQLIFGDTVKELESQAEGKVSINLSEYIGEYLPQNTEQFSIEKVADLKELFVEIVTVSGNTYRMYPRLSIGSSYAIGKSGSITMCGRQENALNVSLTDGTEYEIRYELTVN